MQIVQLYIDGNRMDMFDDESVNITETIQNIRDIGKVFGDFSQTFTVPASSRNNKVFKHYYNNNIDIGFDGRKKVSARIKLNDIDYKVGKVKLEGVDLKNNAPHAYRVTFFGGIVNLKDLLGQDQLGELPWLANFDMNYNKADIIDALRDGKDYTIDSVSYPKALVVPLMTPQQRLYYDSSESIAGNGNVYAGDSVAHGVEWTQFKPAIRIYNIMKAIEKKYNIANGYPSDIVFSDDFFSTTNERFYELYMWLHRKEGTVFDALDGLYARNIDVLPFDSLNGFITSGNSFSISDVFSFGALPYQTTLNVTTLDTNVFNVILLKSGSEVFRQDDNTGSTSYAFDFGGLSNGFYEIRVEARTAVSLTGNLYTERTQATGAGTVTDKTFTFTSSFDLLANYVFEILNQVPNIKVIDFLSGLFKMFNLTAYEEDEIIVVKPLDDFYDEGIDYDISRYVDVKESSVNPALLFKEISFGYQGLGALQTKKHKELFNYEWGTEEFRGDTSYDGGIYKVVLPFEHLKYERLLDLNDDSLTTLQWGWMVSALNQTNVYENGTAYLGKPLLFYPNLVVIGTSLRITDSGTYSDTQRYHLPSNSLETVDSFNINFKAELNEYTNTIFEQTLFQEYYSNYIYSMFDYKNRLTKLTAYLPLRILSKYRLNDRFVINNKKYIINSVNTDLLNGKSTLELLSDYKTIAPPSPLRLPSVTTNATSSISYTQAQFNGEITDVGDPNYTEKGFVWVIGTGTPTTSNNKEIVSGTSAGTYGNLYSLPSDDTTYTVRAYAINTQGTAYGENNTFTTLALPVDRTPQVTTVSSSNLQYNYAQLNGSITDVGQPVYTSKGFYWKVGTGTPTASDGIAYVSGTSSGSYSGAILGLSETTTYSFRAFATNTIGTDLGSVLSFTTPAQPVVLDPPTVTTVGTSVTGTNSAIFYGDVTYVGNPNYTEKGFVWLEGTGTPTTSNNKVIVGGTSGGDYNSSVSLPTASADYRMRAYAINSQGTAYGATSSFVTDTPETCDGGTLFFNSSVITGINATLQTGNVSYGTGGCSTTIPTVDLILSNNEGEWVSASQVTDIQLFEGGTNVTSSYTLGKYLSGDVMHITLDGNFPNIFNDGDHYYEFRITAYNIATLTTTITLPPSNAVNHASVNVVANGSTSFPASRNDTSYNNGVLYPTGEDGDAYEYTVTYTADAGYEFTGIGNVTLSGTTGAGVNQIQDSYTSSTYVIKVYGTIQSTDITGSASWSGSAIADPATAVAIQYRFAGQSTWNAIPGAGIDIGTGGVNVELKVTPDGSWYAEPSAVNLITSYTPEFDYSGDEIIMTVNIRTVGGAEPTQATLLRFYPRASTTSLTSVRFQYYEAI